MQNPTMKEQARTLIRSLVRKALQTGDVKNFLRLRSLALRQKIYRREVSSAELRETLARVGFARGRVVWVQSSWNEFYNVRARPSELVALMRDMLGPEGTLVMPAFPLDQDPGKIFEVDFAPVSTGLLTEVFRRSKDVQRSIQLSASVCAAGPAADFLVRDHHLDPFTWGPLTPYCRLTDADARLVNLGFGRMPSYFTTMHAVECLLHDEVPFFRQVFDGMISYRWRRRSGEEGEHQFHRRIGRINPERFGKFFPKDSYQSFRVSNLDIVAADARTILNRALELGRSGITLFEKASLAADRQPLTSGAAHRGN
jgi:aminoglycoside 3-N-acetyltransferase